MLFRDRGQRIRAAMPTDFGMNPEVAERLKSFGIDARDLAERIRTTSPAVGALRRSPPGSARPVTREFNIDHNDVTQRELLQQTALEAWEPGFIAEELAPSAFVDNTKGTFPVLDVTQERSEIDDRASPLGTPNQLQSSVSLINYTLVPRFLQDLQERKSAMVAPGVASFAKVVERLTVKAKRQHEIRVKRAVQTTGNYASACVQALGAGANWNGGASADPIGDVQDILAAMQAHPTHAVMSLEAWQAVQNNDDIRAILASQYDNKGLLRPMDFGLYFGIPNVVIDEQRVTLIGASSQTRLYDSDKIAFLHVSADSEMRTFLRNFMLRGGAGGFHVQTWFSPSHGQHGADFAKIAYDNDLVVVDNTYGGIITGMRA